MPYIVDNPERTASGGYEGSSASYEYSYPQSLDLKPGSKLHAKIKSEVLQRARVSHDVMQTRFSSWNKIDQTLTCYMPTDEAEKQVKDADSRKPVSMVVPYTYATLPGQAIIQQPRML